MVNEKHYVSLSENASAYLRHRLKSLHMTQSEFAEYMGVEDRTVRRWISGDIHKIETVEDIAAAFHDEAINVVTFEGGDDVFFEGPSRGCANKCCRLLLELKETVKMAAVTRSELTGQAMKGLLCDLRRTWRWN